MCGGGGGREMTATAAAQFLDFSNPHQNKNKNKTEQPVGKTKNSWATSAANLDYQVSPQNMNSGNK